MPTIATPKRPEATRQKLLEAAFAEFYRHGYQGGSLTRIVIAADATKGALFHHFTDKQELGYAVLEEVIEPLIERRWLARLVDSADPIGDLQAAFRRVIREDIESGAWALGCPLNNLAQEMSPLDEGFRTRIERLYAAWRGTVATALADGAREGVVRSDLDPPDVAAFIVVSQMGIWGTGKYSQDEALMTRAGDAVCGYLDTLRPSGSPSRTRGAPRSRRS